jgi:hypothetical protein
MKGFPKFMKLLVITILLSTSLQLVRGQQYFLPPSPEFRQDRLKGVIITETAIGVAVSVGLYFLWYKKFPHSHFHFFNDNREWLQVDKVGHAATAYNIAVIQNDLMRWCGVEPNQSILIGSATAITYMSIIEVMDGFSKHWGFSKGDMLANLVGTALFASQQRWWGDQRVTLKFSAHFSPYSKYYPAELGNNWISRILKDYNGQTYWLSFNLRSFMGVESKFPAWLNLSFGYGAEGMIGASSNPATVNGKSIPYFKRIRQFYLAPDADLFRINGPGALNGFLYLTRFSKIPAPALEFNSEKKFRFHPFYY